MRIVEIKRIGIRGVVRYFWFLFPADLQSRRAVGLGINPGPKLKQLQMNSVTAIPF